ncbi:hypothetical protein [Puia dinghuensis]|nr:hypothetical protein [Puia dinghuensis]
MNKRNLLIGHVDRETALFVDYAGTDKRRKKKYVWIESHPLLGDRIATQTISPRTGKLNKIQYTRYTTLVYLFKDSKDQLRSKRYNFRDEDAAYNKREFAKLIAEIDTTKLVDTQHFNVRIDIMTSFRADSYRELGKRKGPVIEHFATWRNNTLFFLQKCPFELLASYPDLPPYHNRIASTKPEDLEE